MSSVSVFIFSEYQPMISEGGGRDRMVFDFTTTYAISAYHH